MIQGTLATEQEISLQKKGERPTHPEHEEINQKYQEKKIKVRSALVDKFKSTFDKAGHLYLEGLKNNAGANLYWHLKEILQYQELYGTEEVAATIEECLCLGAYHKNSVKRLLEGKKLSTPPLEFNPALSFERVNIKRDLSFYALTTQEVLVGE